MKTLLTSATLIATTLAMPALAKDGDIQSLIDAAKKEGAVYSVG
ncbi:MAG: ABC transporter substrate-binding protein, partial [Vibrionaceae bacterium]